MDICLFSGDRWRWENPQVVVRAFGEWKESCGDGGCCC